MNTQSEEIKREEDLIDIVGLMTDYVRTLRRTWAWVLILAIACGAFFYVRNWMNWTPVYTASSTFTVTAGKSSKASTEGSYSFYDS